MSHTNSTPNYALPQFLPTDKPFWLTDMNSAFSAIDTGIDAAKDAADNAQNDATQALTDAGNASTAAATADAKGAGAVSSLADTYDASATYNLNDIVTYNNLLYKNISQITTPEAWDGTHWTRVTVEDLISLKADQATTYTKTQVDNLLSANDITASVTMNPDCTLVNGQITQVGKLININVVLHADNTIPNNGYFFNNLPIAKGSYRANRGLADGPYYGIDLTSGGVFIDNNLNSLGNFTAIPSGKYVFINISYITNA